ncbi:MAG: WD40 repeat domain-containing protein [bacterium]|nr:WD40 repeat domain-containing protein [bacterium]
MIFFSVCNIIATMGKKEKNITSPVTDDLRDPAELAKLTEQPQGESGQRIFHRFFLNLLLPAWGYEMEKAGLSSFSPGQLKRHTEDYCLRFKQEKFYSGIREMMADKLRALSQEDCEYRFPDRDFRDYFAAVHVLNELEAGVREKTVPPLLKERTLSPPVRRFIGEIEEEHLAKPRLVKGKGWRFNENKESLLVKTLDLCRGNFDGNMAVAVCNILEAWKETRGELSGADLSRLDLSGVNFNGVICSRFYKETVLAARFDESLVHDGSFFSYEHFDWVNSAVYSNDGKRILSACSDHTIKELDAVTGVCLKTLTGHSNIVNSAVYDGGGKTILSASWDHTIKEWDAAAGECTRTLKGHSSYVFSAVYSEDGKRILSASDDRTIKEWDTGTGACIRTITGHTGPVFTAVYSEEGKRIVSLSHHSIREWDAQSGECLESYEGDPSQLPPDFNKHRGSNRLETNMNKIIIKNDSTGLEIKTIVNIPGLWIRGCSFANLHPKSQLSGDNIKRLKMYGAILA